MLKIPLLEPERCAREVKGRDGGFRLKANGWKEFVVRWANRNEISYVAADSPRSNLHSATGHLESPVSFFHALQRARSDAADLAASRGHRFMPA